MRTNLSTPLLFLVREIGLSIRQLQLLCTKWELLRCFIKLLPVCVIITQWWKKQDFKDSKTKTWPSPHVWLFFTGGWPLVWQTERKWSIWPCLSPSKKYIPPSVPVFVSAGRAYPSLWFKAMGLILISGADCITYLLQHFSFFHTQAFFITPRLCLSLSGHPASGVAYPDDMLRTIQERKEEKSFLITLCWIDHSTDWAGCNSQRRAPRVLGTERRLAYGNVKTKHVSSQSHSQDHTAMYSFWHFSTGCF